MLPLNWWKIESRTSNWQGAQYGGMPPDSWVGRRFKLINFCEAPIPAVGRRSTGWQKDQTAQIGKVIPVPRMLPVQLWISDKVIKFGRVPSSADAAGQLIE